ncbi:tetratricopeptide repeat protein [Emcibacter sp.]|uniref:tetratricopeptide repeat protein n=1 Tax=Emcibacter sp. TaxID=1979954 RepID=UPI002AA8AD98|nr:tetratricopeptide repeat protein [Emcibacter sp.]
MIRTTVTVHYKKVSLIALALSLFLLLPGCTTTSTPNDYSETFIGRGALLSGYALWGPVADDLQEPEDNVLEMTQDMLDFLEENVPKKNAEVVKVRALVEAVVSPDGLNMKYNRTATFSAGEAFEMAEGNCLGFSYLTALMARERGLKASFQEVDVPPLWSSEKDKLLYATRHVNVRIQSRTGRDFILDIDQVNVDPTYPTRIMSDAEAEAHYYSNRGAGYLNQGNMKNAFRYLVKAIKLSPETSYFWSNLGVFYRKNNLLDHAEMAYHAALKYDPSNHSALSNLAILYDIKGDSEEAEYFAAKARDYQEKNPYYQFFRAQDAYNNGNYEAAVEFLNKIDYGRKIDQRFYTLLAESYTMLGEADKATAILANLR